MKRYLTILFCLINFSFIPLGLAQDLDTNNDMDESDMDEEDLPEADLNSPKLPPGGQVESSWSASPELRQRLEAAPPMTDPYEVNPIQPSIFYNSQHYHEVYDMNR